MGKISDMHFQTTLTSDHVAGYGSVSFSELKIRGRKRERKKKERRIPGKI